MTSFISVRLPFEIELVRAPNEMSESTWLHPNVSKFVLHVPAHCFGDHYLDDDSPQDSHAQHAMNPDTSLQRLTPQIIKIISQLLQKLRLDPEATQRILCFFCSNHDCKHYNPLLAIII